MNIKTRKYILLALFFTSFLPIILFFRYPFGLDAPLDILFPLYATSIADFLGLIGIILLVWQPVLGARGIIGRIIPDTIWINDLHKKIGIYGTILIFLHPAFVAIGYGSHWLDLLFPKEVGDLQFFISMGQIAIFFLVIIWVTSATIRKRLPYRLWKQIHFLGYIAFPFAFIHGIRIGSNLTTLGLLTYYWYFLGIIFPLVIIFRLLYQFGFTKYKYYISEITDITHNVKKYTLKPTKSYLIPKAGQFIYIQTKLFGESHPFTISHINKKTKEISISTKVTGPFTKELTTVKQGQIVYIDGPYGVFTQLPEELSKSEVIIFAGGIGITPFLELLKQENKPVTLIYSNASYKDIAFKQEIEELITNKKNIRHFNYISDEEIVISPDRKGRITKEDIQQIITEKLNNSLFLICGPLGYMKVIKKMLKEIGVENSKIFTEEFTM